MFVKPVKKNKLELAMTPVYQRFIYRKSWTEKTASLNNPLLKYFLKNCTQ